MIDLNGALQQLYAQRDRLAAAIAELESLNAGRNRRGRKSMGAEERREVAARMRRYWASRKSAKASA